MDPLSLLRQYTRGRHLKHVVKHEDRITFGDQYSYPKNTLTAFKSSRGENYTLETVLHFITIHSGSRASAAEYVQSCTKHAVPPVVIQDRKAMQDYLEGRLDPETMPQLSNIDDVALLTIPAEALGPAHKRARPNEDAEASAINQLRRQERQLRDRNSMLLAPARSFKEVLGVVDKALERKPSKPSGGRKPAPQQVPAAGSKPARAPTGAAAVIKPSGRFERETTKAELQAVGLQADIDLYYRGSQAAAAGAAPGAAPGGAKPPQAQQAAAAKPAPGSASKAGPADGAGEAAAEKLPIIIVPKAVTAIMGMTNAPTFFETGQFMTQDQARAQGIVKQQRVVITRKPGTKSSAVPVKFVVTDTPPAANSSEWRQVVAVVASGASWQFKEFPFKGAKSGDMVDTFNRMLGVYFHFIGEKPPEAVHNWNVKKLPISREARHLDSTIVLKFYQHLEDFYKGKDMRLKIV